MTGRRPVTDPASSQPPGSWSLLAVLDEVLTASGSAVATVIGTGRKIRVRSLFPGTGYSAQTTVWVTEVLGSLRAFAVANGGGGAGVSGCDLSKCVDSGSVHGCGGGDSCRIYLCSGLDMGAAYAPDAPVSPMQFTHVSGCTWESRSFVIGNNTYLWRLTADSDPPLIALVNVSGPDEPWPPVEYQGPKPYAPLCGNEFWLHRQPGAAWRRSHPHFPPPGEDQQPIYPPVFPSRICLAPDLSFGACAVCQDLTAPRYLRIAVGPGANADGAEHCGGIAWDIVGQTNVEPFWDDPDLDPLLQTCVWSGFGPCGPLDLPVTAVPGGPAGGFLASPFATADFHRGLDIYGNPAANVTIAVVATMKWVADWAWDCTSPQWETGQSLDGYQPFNLDQPFPDTTAIFLEVRFLLEVPADDFDCLASHQIPFDSYRQYQVNEFGAQFPTIWEPGYCNFSGLTCMLEPSA